jgi:hypothetical protein
MKVLRDDHQACIKRYNFSILIQNPELVEVLARSRSYAHPIRILLIMEVFLSTGTSPPTRRTVGCRPIILLGVTAWTCQLQVAIYRDTQRPVH